MASNDDNVALLENPTEKVSIEGSIKKAGKNLKESANETYGSAKDAVKETYSGAKDAVKKTYSGAKNAVKKTYNDAGEGFKNLKNRSSEYLKKGRDKLAKNIENIGESKKDKRSPIEIIKD